MAVTAGRSSAVPGLMMVVMFRQRDILAGFAACRWPGGAIGWPPGRVFCSVAKLVVVSVVSGYEHREPQASIAGVQHPKDKASWSSFDSPVAAPKAGLFSTSS